MKNTDNHTAFRFLKFFLPVLLGLAAYAPIHAEEKAELISVKKIWDKGEHNAFTDLTRYKGLWYCTFREGKAHVSPDGTLRVLQSRDGENWESAALVTDPAGDLRDPKFAISPGNELMMVGAIANRSGPVATHQSAIWFSKDGGSWGKPHLVGDKDIWLWRVTWHKNQCYGVGYATDGRDFVRLYKSSDGKTFTTLVPELFSKRQNGKAEANETSLLFLEDDTAYCLMRRDADTGSAQLGKSKPPYTEWAWTDLGVNVGGPHMIRLPDGRFVAAGRLYDSKVRTGILWLDPEKGKLREILSFPSSGDSSYPGLVWHNNLLWVSYYSSHEGKTSIYLAKVKLPAP